MSDIESERLERWLGKILGVGAVSSTALLLAGLVLQLAGALPHAATVMTHAGLIVLIATPVARVVASVVDFTMSRDWTFTALTALVLVILLGSLMVAIR
jgi:uncharacterized membrane protein